MNSFADRDIFACFAGIRVGHIAQNVGPNPALCMEADEESDDEAAMAADGEEDDEGGGQGDDDEDKNEEEDEDEGTEASSDVHSDGGDLDRLA